MKVFKDFKAWSEQNEGRTEILTPAGRMAAIHKFKPGASEEKIRDLSDFFSIPLPPDYIKFLRICNGASLFEHPEYGGENFLYSAQDVIYYNEASDRKIVVANILDDQIIIDLDRWESGNMEYLLLGESFDPAEAAGRFYSNFEIWLERFVISQGTKFWYWKTDRRSSE